MNIPMFVRELEGMVIGSVIQVVITADTPIDYTQWEDGKPWHIRSAHKKTQENKP